MKELAKRLEMALNYRGLKPIDLSRKTGIGKSSISQYLSGEYNPKQTNIYKMADALGVDPDWLNGRNVPMEATKFTNTKVILDKYNLYRAALNTLGWEEIALNSEGKDIFEAFDDDEDDEIDRCLLTNETISFEISLEDQKKFEDDLVNFVADRIQKLMIKAAGSIGPKE